MIQFIERSIMVLCGKLGPAVPQDKDEALKFTQSILNLAHAISVIKSIKPDKTK